MSNYQASFEHTLKDGRTVTVCCADWQAGEPEVGIGAGYENVWAEDEDGKPIELADSQVEELYAAAGKLGYPDDEDWLLP